MSKHKFPKRKVIIDTREQLPWPWPEENVLRQTLKYGDYSLEGLESLVRIERKSTQDFVGSLSPKKLKNAGPDARSRRERFKDELQWLGENVHRSFLIIEGDLKDISSGLYPSMMHPAAVIGALVSWSLRFNVHAIFASNHAQAWGYANRILVRSEQLLEAGELDNGADRRPVDESRGCEAGSLGDGSRYRAGPGTIRRLLLPKTRRPDDQQVT